MGSLRKPGYLCLPLALLVVAAGCNRRDADRLACVGKRVQHQVEHLTESLREQLQAVLPVDGVRLNESRLAVRVSARLRWDKALEGATIEVHAIGNEVELKGTICDPSQRQRAIDVADGTVGVAKVIDRLELNAKNDE